MEWISVKDRLPERTGFMTSSTVLVSGSFGVIAAKLHTGNGWFYELGSPHQNDLLMVRGPNVDNSKRGLFGASLPEECAEFWSYLPAPPAKESHAEAI